MPGLHHDDSAPGWPPRSAMQQTVCKQRFDGHCLCVLAPCAPEFGVVSTPRVHTQRFVNAATVFHYIFVPLTLGLIVAVAAMDTLRMVTGRHEWRRAARFWYRFFVVAWPIGMATGFPLRLQLDHQWSGYSAHAREVIHAIMGMEGTIAPAMISLVLVLATLSHGQPALDRAITRWALASCSCRRPASSRPTPGCSTRSARRAARLASRSSPFAWDRVAVSCRHGGSAGRGAGSGATDPATMTRF